jgi:hypothetical protein
MTGLLTIFILLSSIKPSFASDHIDGPVTTANAVADLTDLYAFPTPMKPGFLSIILDEYPFVGASGHFTDKVNYNVLVRRAAIDVSSGHPTFSTSDEVTINCTFKTPAITADHVVMCRSTNHLYAETRYDVVQEKAEGDDFRLYAGMRSDPFFFNAKFAKSAANDGKLLPPKNENVMDNLNVLTIVMDIEISKLFKDNPPALVAVAAETTTQDSPDAPLRRIDRIGRPEITNVSMVAHHEPDLRDQYNFDRPFEVPPANWKLYRDRLAENIAFYDALDGHKDWPDEDRMALANILADDFLVVDLSKPCRTPTFFEIEESLLRHRAYETCGGRKPNDRIMSVLFTLYVGGLGGRVISDGVEQPSRAVSEQFPYLAEPDLSLWSRTKAFLARELVGL